MVGKQVHSDYCRVAGRPINDWLRDPAQMPAFLQALQQAGWIRRHEAPENSRFWKLIEGERAEMFGVFSAYEQQVLHDWILGDAAENNSAQQTGQTTRALGFKARQRLLETLARRGTPAKDAVSADTTGGDATVPQAVHLHAVGQEAPSGASDFDHELRQLDRALARTADKEEAMQLLAQLMSPARHHTAVGLKATRLFVQMLG